MLSDLAKLRIEKKMTQQQLADKAGVSKSTISNIENNKVHPQGDTMCRVARALDKEPDHLYKFLYHDMECWGGGEST